MIRVILYIVLLIVSALLVVAIGAALLILLAYGLGLGLSRLLPFNQFQTTVLSLAGLGMFSYIAVRVLGVFLTSSPIEVSEDGEADEDEEEEEDEGEGPEDDRLYPGIPRWRQPSRPLEFTGVGPDDRCPCGSGRKYKNCHGRNWKRKQSSP